MKKSIFLNLLLVITTVIMLILLLRSQESNERLIRQIELKDSLSKSRIKKDSVFAKKTEEYAKVITKYVSDCNFQIGNKKISTAEVVNMTNKAMKQVKLLSDSLSYMKRLNEEYKRIGEITSKENNLNSDSSFIYKNQLNQILRTYGVRSSYKRDGDKYLFFVEDNKKIDSALVLLPYYRHKLTLDSTKSQWTIVTDTERSIKKAEKKRKKN